VGDGAVTKGDDGGNDDEDEKRDVGADASGILEPLADVEADEVEADGDGRRPREISRRKGRFARGCPRVPKM